MLFTERYPSLSIIELKCIYIIQIKRKLGRWYILKSVLFVMLQQKEQLNVTDAQHAREWDSVFRDGRHWVLSKLQALIACTKSLYHLLIL